MKLAEAAFIFGIHEKTLRRAIAAGKLQTTRDRRGVYDVTIEAVQSCFGTEPRKISLDAPEPYSDTQKAILDAFNALSDRVTALEGIITRPRISEKVTHDATERKPYVPPPPNHVPLHRAGELAKAHGVGRADPEKKWKWTVADRPDEKTVLAYIQRMRPAQFRKCADLTCACQEL